MVPNAALRWIPQPERIAPDARGAAGGKGSRPFRGPPQAADRASGPGASATIAPKGTVWVPDGNYVRPVRVRVGISDGTMTEVQNDKLAEGTEVVLAEGSPAGRGGAGSRGGNAANSTNSNPFVPQFPTRRR